MGDPSGRGSSHIPHALWKKRERERELVNVFLMQGRQFYT